MTTKQPLDALRAALEQQRRYEAEHWPFVDEHNQPTGSGESITYHLASLYCWSPQYVVSLPLEQRDERLKEIWKSFGIAGSIIKAYEEATLALLNDQAESEPPSGYDAVMERKALGRELQLNPAARYQSDLERIEALERLRRQESEA
jgi:hypothetical protein